MFAQISPRYDLLNHLLSANMDKRWRQKVANELSSLSADARILDVACGTGDLALTLFEVTSARVVGTDFCRPMLEIAKRKAAQMKRAMPFIEGDALNLPFANDSFDGVTIAFGLRNLAHVGAGLNELFRILKPRGTAAVLEFSKPRVPGLSFAFQFYFNRVLPLLGGIVSGSRSAYRYLPDSVAKFPDQEQLVSLMRAAGFENVRYSNLTGGIAALHMGLKGKSEDST
jgi:demethylmenaquinone methyltransferase / 2-methoxy-6-polyprenyl-1,4-benzoquinol methylase